MAVVQLSEFYDYKNQLMEDLLTNAEIVRLLSDEYDQTGDADAADSLMYKQVFPYEYIPDTVEHGQTYICCDVDIQKSQNKTFLDPVIYVWVFTHKSKMRLPGGGIRVDKLCGEIADAINGSRYYGLGELDLYSTRRFAPVADYQGKVMTFQATEFNRHSPSKKQVPTNRKMGI